MKILGLGLPELGIIGMPVLIVVIIVVVIAVVVSNSSKGKEASSQQRSSTGAVDDSASQIKQYKELLDQGVITQDEFDAKKKELLK